MNSAAMRDVAPNELRRRVVPTTRTLRRIALNVSLTFPPASGVTGPTKLGFASSEHSLDQLRPDPLAMDKAIYELSTMSINFTGRGAFSATARMAPDDFEALMGTNLSRHKVDGLAGSLPFLFPAVAASWSPRPEVAALVDDIYIQWPAIPMVAGPPPLGLFGNSRIYLPGDIARLLNAQGAGIRGMSGKGVRVAMVDTGFAMQHPYFAGRRWSVLSPGGWSVPNDADADGHGTAMCANLFAVAPDVEFIGITLGGIDSQIMVDSLHAGVLEALRHDPDILVLSVAYDLRSDLDDMGATRLPGSCNALALTLQHAMASGVAVLCGAGNGQFAFPAMLPGVIAVGGCMIEAGGKISASDMSSAFVSQIYPGRYVPDVCAISGNLENQAYLMLPCPPGSYLDRSCSSLPDGTPIDDGWCFSSGTSAAGPQVAGVCALMLQANPGLTIGDLRSALVRTARDITSGNANIMTGVAKADAGWDIATGYGLVDATACLSLI